MYLSLADTFCGSSLCVFVITQPLSDHWSRPVLFALSQVPPSPERRAGSLTSRPCLHDASALAPLALGMPQPEVVLMGLQSVGALSHRATRRRRAPCSAHYPPLINRHADLHRPVLQTYLTPHPVFLSLFLYHSASCRGQFAPNQA